MKRDKLYSLYAKLERRIAPGLRYSQYFYEDVLREFLPQGASWLDLGCGHKVLPLWREKQEKDLVSKAGVVVGFDYDSPSLRKHRSIHNLVCGEISALPFADNTFDLVTANMVVEHLDAPQVQFKEVQRVLRPGGTFLFHTPNIKGYQTVAARMMPEFLKAPLAGALDGRPAGDVFKTHYRANSESQIRHVALDSGFDIGKIRFIASSAKFAIIAPLAFFELFWIRLLLTHKLRHLRTNLIVTLTKPQRQGAMA